MCSKSELRAQAYGTVLTRAKRLHSGYNPKEDRMVETLRSTLEIVDGPVLELVRMGSLNPEEVKVQGGSDACTRDAQD